MGQFFCDNDLSLSECQSLLSEVGDLERIISRAATGKILPREVKSLSRSLRQMAPIAQLACTSQVDALVRLGSGMKACEELIERIERTLAESPAAMVGKGDVIAKGVDA